MVFPPEHPCCECLFSPGQEAGDSSPSRLWSPVGPVLLSVAGSPLVHLVDGIPPLPPTPLIVNISLR